MKNAADFRRALAMALAIAALWLAVLPAALAQFAGATPIDVTQQRNESGSAVQQSTGKGADGYFVTTPQLDDAVTPLKHLPPDGVVTLHASVAIVPDPIETTLGKSFDLEVAALLSAYQAKGYELDGFAFSWRPRPGDPKKTASTQATDGYRRQHRATPSLLLFRNDRWRQSGQEEAKDRRVPAVGGEPDVEYDLVYLVGDAPSYGIQQESFAAAAHCALRFNGMRGRIGELRPAEPCDGPVALRNKTLNIIGPAFSGSMQSLAVAIGRLGCERECEIVNSRQQLAVNVVSPTTSVRSNSEMKHHSFISGATMDYAPISWGLDEQMMSLAEFLCGRNHLPSGRIVFLVEQSTFGRGAKDLALQLNEALAAKYPSRHDEGPGKDTNNAIHKNCLDDPTVDSGSKAAGGESSAPEKDPKLSIVVRMFSPNIASIRAEHSQLRRAELAAREKVPKSGSRLLELDMTNAESGADRPPVYQPSLSSRSDELMLYRLFDSLRMWTPPDAVVIVATDVRDRLFLLSEVRKALPSALPVMLEMDFLMVHPDYRAISRGSVVVPARDATVNITRCMGGSVIGDCPTTAGEGDASGREQTGKAESARRDCERTAMSGLCKLKAFIAKDPARRNRDRVSFPTDHAANTFRAAFMLIDYRESAAAHNSLPKFSDYAKKKLCEEKGRDCAPSPVVATLAGFQSLTGTGPGSVAAADFRMAMQRPWFIITALVALFFLILGIWLSRDKGQGRVMYRFGSHLIQDSFWLINGLEHLRVRALWVRRIVAKRRSMRQLWRGLGLAPRVWERRQNRQKWWSGRQADVAAMKSLTTSARLQLPALLVLFAAIVLPVAIWKLWQIVDWDSLLDPCFGVRSCRFQLAHGRDLVAATCLWLLYACLALVGAMRSDIADRRYAGFGSQLKWPGAGDDDRPWLIPMGIMLAVVLVFYWSTSDPVSVDPRVPWLLAAGVLICGAAFLVNLRWHLRNFSRLTLSLSRCIPTMRQRPGMSDWPSSQILQELPQTPFNISLGRRDILALQAQSPSEWMDTTLRVIGSVKGWPPPSNGEIERWQRQLIAELKLLVVAIRTCAWCAMMAPLAVLLSMTAFPPVYERWLNTASIFLLVVSFLVTIFVVLRLEKDPMLGPMFTRHGDDLSFGAGLRALWPKFVAMGAVLIPLVLPDVWTWLHTLIRSINTLG